MSNPSNSEKTLDESMEELARLLAQDVRDPSAPIETRIDAFKALTAYYLGSKKKKPGDAPAATGPKFGEMRDRITNSGGVGHG